MIDVKDPAFEKLVSPSAPIEKIASGFQFTEGPVFSRIGYLLFSDIPPKRIMKWSSTIKIRMREVLTYIL